jgi:antitoxin ParD1/3/4
MPRQLTPQHEALIERIITSGQYTDADQVITEALRHLAARDRQREELRAKLQIGLDELDRGEGVEWTPELMEQLSREADDMYRRGEKPDLDVCP